MSTCLSGGRQLVGLGIDVEFVTILVDGSTALKVARDIPVNFKRPHRFFMVASIMSSLKNSSVFVHFQPLTTGGLQDGSNPTNTLTMTGAEPGIWLAYNPLSSAPTYWSEGRWFRLRDAVRGFLVDVDHPAGGVGIQKMTFLGSDFEFAAVNML